MNKRILLVAALLSLVACSSNTTGSISDGTSSTDELSSGEEGSSDGNPSSSGPRSSGTNSSGTPGSSSSFTPLPDVDSSLVAGPNDLQVSSFVGPKTIVLTWTDIPSFARGDYTGYKVFRNDNYTGWDSVGVAPAEQQFFRDNSFDTVEYKSIYRIIAYKKRTGKADTLISRFSNEAGIVPVNSMGFKEVVFDKPDAATMLRYAPSVYDLFWKHSGLQPELGFVVQALHLESEYQTVPLDTGDTILGVPDTNYGKWLTSEANWYSLDTLSESDNHLVVKGPVLNSTYYTKLFRVYAYYNDEFGAMISEFSSEVKAPLAYDPPIVFTPPTVFSSLMLSTADTTLDFSWNITHAEIENSPYTDTTFWEYELLQGASYQAGALAIGMTAMTLSPSTNVCSISLRVRLVWTDIYGVTDRSAWSVASGTKPGTWGNLSDKAKYCKE